MALVSGGRSSLNPDAPLFIPAAHQGEDIFSEEENGFDGNVAGLLPDNIDLDVDEDILNMEAQFEEFLQSTESEYGMKPFGGVMGNGFGKNPNALVKSLSMPKQSPKSPREPIYWEKPAKHVGRNTAPFHSTAPLKV
ncbi:hypothetical protein DH2020_041514 [Rehmannia glutinosa]|uniref:Uncharacterized protein n=1 Tax=Rehmannia glutinosa TaxID=99300 RepID=A0ABR0UR36_REHGL